MWTVLGKNDEVTTCECCGRSNLKATVILTNGDGEVRFGTECAARRMLCSGKEVEAAVKAVAVAAEKERIAKQWAETEAYESWLLATYGEKRSNLQRRAEWRKAIAA